MGVFGFNFGIGFSGAKPSGAVPPELAFILAHEAATTLTMATGQRNAVKTLVDMLNGIGTTFGSVLLPEMVARDARMWIFCPSNDTTISFAGCNVDLITATVKGSFNNYLPADLTINGLTGGSGKWFASDKSNRDYPDLSYGLYFYTNNFSAGGIETGESNATNSIRTAINPTETTIASSVSGNGFVTVTEAQANGSSFWMGVQRGNGANIDTIKNGSIISTDAFAFGTSPNFGNYWGAKNTNGSATNFNASRFGVLLQGIQYLNANELADLHQAISTYNANIIPGGR